MIHMVVAGMEITGFFNYDEPVYQGDLIEADGEYYRVNTKRRLVDEDGNVVPVLDTSMAMTDRDNEDSKS